MSQEKSYFTDLTSAFEDWLRKNKPEEIAKMEKMSAFVRFDYYVNLYREWEKEKREAEQK